MSTVSFNSIKLVKGGAIVGSDLASGTITSTEAEYVFGGSSNMWGTTLTKSDVEASDFGFVVSFIGSGYPSGNSATYYLKLTNFSVVIPDGATITGVEVFVDAKIGQISSSYYAYVDSASIQVFYIEGTQDNNERDAKLTGGLVVNSSRSTQIYGGDGRYVEHFTSTTKKDEANTTASWTTDGTAEMSTA